MINLKLGDMKEPLPERIISKFRERLFDGVNLYQMDYSRLVERLAGINGVRQENIVLTGGTDDSIELLCRAFRGDILVFTPSYYEFTDAPKRNGLKYETKNCFDGNGFKLKYSEAEVKVRSLVFLCNPNNPFGLLSKQEITELAAKTSGVVAVDETYIDFAGETVIGEIEKAKNILVMRSFSKSFSLAGMRIGYIAGSRELIGKVKAIKQICNVASASVNAALVALDETDYFRERIAAVMKGKRGLEEFLEEKGFKVIRTHTNNVIIKFPGKAEADKFYKHMEKSGILVNQGNGLSTCGLDNTFIRLNYGTERQMKEFRKAAEGFK